MNHIYKTLWSTVHQQYVVTNEKQASHGKPSKAVLTAVVASAVMAMAGNAVAYQETGVIGDSASWKTAEYKADWGLDAMHAADAYTLGFNGKGAVVGMMDTGALATHPEFSKERFKYVTYKDGFYSSNGNRYPVPEFDTFGNGKYELGQKFIDSLSKKGQAGEVKQLTGAWILHVNDSHGTHVVGTIGANRDGNEMHGVAWGADVIVGNNGGLDNSNYGPYQDYNFYKSVYEDTVKGVDGKAPKFINSSWGTNMRVWGQVKDAEGKDVAGVKTNASVPVNTVKDTEYEYFIFNNHARENWKNFEESYAKGDKQQILNGRSNGNLTNFVDAIYESVKGRDVVHMITTGNRVYDQPYYRANYPYFTPNAEHHWVAVAGLQRVEGQDGKFENIEGFNKPGEAKWWSVVAPGKSIYSTVVFEDTYVKPDKKHKLGEPFYEAWGGTSMANPHVTGALGVFASRYPEMTAFQVRDTMLTTANRHNEDGSSMDRWTAVEGVPDVKYGWGVPDLNKGMFGPAQFLGMLDDDGKFHQDFEYKLSGNDVWSNDISQVAHDARLAEEKKWVDEVYTPWKQKIGFAEGKVIDSDTAAKLAKDKSADFEGEFVLGNVFTGGARYIAEDGSRKSGTVTAEVVGSYKQDPMTAEQIAKYKAEHPEVKDDEIPNINPIVGVPDELAKVDLADAILWRDMAYETRYKAISERAKHEKLGLVKSGSGTLALLGKAQYKGDTVVNNGSLYAFGKTFGEGSGKVVVNESGTFGITPVYVDQLTLQGRLEDGTEGKAAVEVKKGGTLDVLVSKKALEGTGETAKVASLNLEEGATVRLNSLDWTDEVPEAEKLKGEVAEQFRAADPKAKALDLVKAVADNENADFKISGAIEAGEDVKADAAKLVNPEYIAVKQESKVDGKTLTVTLSKKSAEEQAKTVAALGLEDNAQEVLASLGDKMGLKTVDTDIVKNTVKQLSNDNIANAQTAVLMNNVAITNAVIGHASGFGHEKQVKLGEGTIWGNAIGSWGKVKLGEAQTKTDYYTALIGGDMNVTSDVKLGGFVGYGHGNLKADEFGKTKTNDFHAGLYANAEIEKVAKLTGGMIYTHQKRDMNRVMGEVNSNNKFNTNIVELFAEAACPGFSFSNVNVEPYVGMNWIHFQGKDIEEEAFGETVKTSLKSQNVYGAGIGVRADVPFSVGSVAMTAKGDVAYRHFFGDKPAYDVTVNGATAALEGKKLSNIGTVSLGVDAQLSKAAKAGLSFEGAYGNKVHSNGVMANFTYNF